LVGTALASFTCQKRQVLRCPNLFFTLFRSWSSPAKSMAFLFSPVDVKEHFSTG